MTRMYGFRFIFVRQTSGSIAMDSLVALADLASLTILSLQNNYYFHFRLRGNELMLDMIQGSTVIITSEETS